MYIKVLLNWSRKNQYLKKNLNVNLLIRSGKIAELIKAAIPPSEDPTEACTYRK